MTAVRTQPNEQEIAEAQRLVGAIADAFSAKVVGQENLRESLLIGLLAGGHVLIESVPGLAKSSAVTALPCNRCRRSKPISKPAWRC